MAKIWNSWEFNNVLLSQLFWYNSTHLLYLTRCYGSVRDTFYYSDILFSSKAKRKESRIPQWIFPPFSEKFSGKRGIRIPIKFDSWWRRRRRHGVEGEERSGCHSVICNSAFVASFFPLPISATPKEVHWGSKASPLGVCTCRTTPSTQSCQLWWGHFLQCRRIESGLNQEVGIVRFLIWLRGLPDMTSTKFLEYLTPSPLSPILGLI